VSPAPRGVCSSLQDRPSTDAQVHLKGRLLLECSTAPSRFAHALLTPAQTQRRWLLVARSGLSDQVQYTHLQPCRLLGYTSASTPSCHAAVTLGEMHTQRAAYPIGWSQCHALSRQTHTASP